MENQQIKAEYTLVNVVECMRLCEDARNPINSFIINSAYRWIREKLERNGELTTSDREKFMEKFYNQAKNL
jgi:hypothetical protein